MANPRSLVYALYTHWDTVELLVRLSREFAVLTSDQVLNGIAKVSGQLDAEAQGAAMAGYVSGVHQCRSTAARLSGPVKPNKCANPD